MTLLAVLPNAVVAHTDEAVVDEHRARGGDVLLGGAGNAFLQQLGAARPVNAALHGGPVEMG